jgi:hypothetical protein
MQISARSFVVSEATISALITAIVAVVVFWSEPASGLPLAAEALHAVRSQGSTILLAAGSAAWCGWVLGQWAIDRAVHGRASGVAVTLTLLLAIYVVFGVASAVFWCVRDWKFEDAIQWFLFGTILAPYYSGLLSLPLAFVSLMLFNRRFIDGAHIRV